MKQLRAVDTKYNSVLWGECTLCHTYQRLDVALSVVDHDYVDNVHRTRWCRGSGRAARHRTITNKLNVR
jgi:hypothetical protein